MTAEELAGMLRAVLALVFAALHVEKVVQAERARRRA